MEQKTELREDPSIYQTLVIEVAFKSLGKSLLNRWVCQLALHMENRKVDLYLILHIRM